MNHLQVFNFGGNEIRTIEKDGQPWFVLKDVCNVLDIDQVAGIKRRLTDDVISNHPILDSIGRHQETTIINEDGLYDVILESRKPEARSFRKWITGEVIPTIRKHGAYMTPETIEKTILNPDFIINLATELKKEQEKSASLQQQIISDKTKVLFAESLQTSQDCILIANLAKLLKQNGVDTGEKRLYRWLRENGYLGKHGDHYNMPTQRSMELRLFEVKTRTINNPGEEPRISKTTVVTGRGQMYFLNKFKNMIA
ncbi:phage antirepressor KilAC domain-containing protein [Paenibacillus macerans]|uniref:phage antirepressor KilAC domain-containing protein n=1 Tax=Paenibacillus macerans TaxID=44252 RepID=UPI00203EE587|nr:phage antirepressor [Paenibacillus macerans]MCM3703778.1 phage antirepressor [Paenibacillus macerans]